jgi:hypothetical protein
MRYELALFVRASKTQIGCLAASLWLLIPAISFAQPLAIPREDIELQVWMTVPHASYVGRVDVITVDVIHPFPERVDVTLDGPPNLKVKPVRKWLLGRVTGRVQFEVMPTTVGTQPLKAVARVAGVTATDVASLTVRGALAYRIADFALRYYDVLRFVVLAIIVLAIVGRRGLTRFVPQEIAVAAVAVFGLAPLLMSEWIGRLSTTGDFALAGGGAAVGIFSITERLVEWSRVRRSSGVHLPGTAPAPAGQRSVLDALAAIAPGHHGDTRTFLEARLARSMTHASDAMRRANTHLLVGVTIGLSGLAFFFLTTTSLIPDTGSAGLTPGALGAALLKIAPRAAVLIFIEVTAGFFLRQYAAALADYHKFEALQRQREAEVLSFLIRDRDAESPELLDFAKSIMITPETDVLKNGETTTHQAAQENVPNEMLSAIRTAQDSLLKIADRVSKVSKEDAH